MKQISRNALTSGCLGVMFSRVAILNRGLAALRLMNQTELFRAFVIPAFCLRFSQSLPKIRTKFMHHNSSRLCYLLLIGAMLVLLAQFTTLRAEERAAESNTEIAAAQLDPLQLRPATAHQAVIVVCPTEWHDTLAPWVVHRQAQHYHVEIITPENDAATTTKALRTAQAKLTASKKQRWRFCSSVMYANQRRTISRATRVFAPANHAPQNAPQPASAPGTPTHLVPAKVITKWGGELTVASDLPYADLDGDSVPELSIGAAGRSKTLSNSARSSTKQFPMKLRTTSPTGEAKSISSQVSAALAK